MSGALVPPQLPCQWSCDVLVSPLTVVSMPCSTVKSWPGQERFAFWFDVQSLWQPSVSTLLPSSHSSAPMCTNPSPHAAALHPETHASVSTLLPSSLASPASTMPLPQPAPAVHVDEQASPSSVLPSSHCSTPACTKPSPQAAAAQPATQA